MQKVKVGTSKIHGLGVLAIRRILSGESILLIDDSRIVDAMHPLRPDVGECDYHQDYLGKGKVVLMAAPERHINHSCEPNTYVKTQDGVRHVIALKEIEAGEEITYDYLINGLGDFEWDCHCGVQSCRHHHRSGFFTLPRQLQLKYFPLLDSWFLEEFPTECADLRRAREQTTEQDSR